MANMEGAVEIDGMICVPKEQHEEQAKPEEQQEEVSTDELKTCPRDPRFQQQNVTNWCFQMYIDFHRCTWLMGSGAKECNYFKRCYESICPNQWIENWDDQMQNGTFPRDIYRETYYYRK